MGDRFHFFAHARPAPTSRRYELDLDTDDDRQQLSPRLPSFSPSPSDIEAQHGPEMAERRSRFVLGRWSRPTMPSFFGIGRPDARPSSSHYSEDTEGDLGLESPKTPDFPTLGVSNLPSIRLHLPNLQRTWTRGSDGPPSRPPTALDDVGAFSGPVEGLEEPIPAVAARHRQSTRGQGRSRRRAGASDSADGGRRRRRRRRHHPGGSERTGGSSSNRPSRRLVDENEARRGEVRDGGEENRPSSYRHRHKRFLFCFPWIPSKRIRSQTFRCFVSGLFLALLLTVYLALSITRNINNSEFTVLLILVILFITIFFCHGLIRLCLLIVRADKNPQEEEEEVERARRAAFPQIMGSGGYAVPKRPIRVVLARDEEAAGLESETTRIKPPAYGLWRESVRVDPNRIYWMRNEAAPSTLDEESLDSHREHESSTRHEMSERPRPVVLRPPSYASDDGVGYVVEAQGRSIAPTTDVPLGQHPSEAGRTQRW